MNENQKMFMMFMLESIGMNVTAPASKLSKLAEELNVEDEDLFDNEFTDEEKLNYLRYFIVKYVKVGDWSKLLDDINSDMADTLDYLKSHPEYRKTVSVDSIEKMFKEIK